MPNATDAQFQAITEAVIRTLPPWVRQRLHNLAIFVTDFADDAVLRDMGIADPYDLLGLYTGTPLPERGAQYGYGNLPDVIHLYREPILAHCQDSGDSLKSAIRHLVIHEIGHYFGFSDAQMAALQDQDRA